MTEFQYHDAACVVAGFTIPVAKQNSFEHQRLNYTHITKCYISALSYLTTLLYATIIQRR